MIQCTRFACALGALVLLASCSQSAVSGVNATLDARDQAISERNIAAYSLLIADDYNDHGRDKKKVVAQMLVLFDQFDELKMESFGRDVFIADDDNARAAQSYRLNVLMDGSWREMLQREELTLSRTGNGWRISAGL